MWLIQCVLPQLHELIDDDDDDAANDTTSNDNCEAHLNSANEKKSMVI